MEPLLLPEGTTRRADLIDLALELSKRSTALRRALPESVVVPLARLVRSMDCYYSNLIEGHATHPNEIERALSNDYSHDPRKRDLQLEATAHIAVQEWIDHGGLDGRALTEEGLREIHRRFCERLPDEFLSLSDGETSSTVVPGRYRTRDVQVGQHVATSPGAIPRFMRRFEEAHSRLGLTERILASATSHHRLAWIHPFLDGNGRVVRLMSYAVLREALETGGIWSIARGLARNVGEYKQRLAQCDLPRRNDLDGRGDLSEGALLDFTGFFLRACIDQVKFMEQLVDPPRLRSRVMTWAKEEAASGKLPQRAATLLEAILFRGELPRRDVPELLGVEERHARRVVAALTARGVVESASPRAPLRIAFPATLASRWMPGLFPDKTDED